MRPYRSKHRKPPSAEQLRKTLPKEVTDLIFKEYLEVIPFEMIRNDEGEPLCTLIHRDYVGHHDYETHFNYHRPFRVVIDGDGADLTVRVYDEEGEGGPPLRVFHPAAVFVGYSPRNEITRFYGTYGSEYTGNSILLRLYGRVYAYIQASIFLFKAEGPITAFAAPMGSADVPQSYAVDAEGRRYLLAEAAAGSMTVDYLGLSGQIPIQTIVEGPYIGPYFASEGGEGEYEGGVDELE